MKNRSDLGEIAFKVHNEVHNEVQIQGKALACP